MIGYQLYTDVRKRGGLRPGRHQEERGGRACLVSMTDWALDGGGERRESDLQVLDEGYVGQK